MAVSLSLVFAVALVAQTLAAFAPRAIGSTIQSGVAKSGGPHRVQLVSAGTVFKNGPLSVQKTYEKYGKAAPDNVKAAAAALQSGSVTATPEAYDQAYLCPVTVGTPGVEVMLDFDTGSSDLWVFSTLQNSSQTVGHALYDPNASNTSVLVAGESWDISYADGTGAAGVVYADQVVVGPVIATQIAVDAATSASAVFVENTNSDGLVRHDAPGSYDFGFINSTKYTGSIAYKNISPDSSYWLTTSAGYQVNKKVWPLPMDVIMDSGTTLVYLPDITLVQYYRKIKGAINSFDDGGWIFPCKSTLLPFGVEIGGVYHTIPAEYMNYAPIDKKYCYGSLQSSDSIGVNILGDVFMKSQFVVFDQGLVRLGVASKSGVV